MRKEDRLRLRVRIGIVLCGLSFLGVVGVVAGVRDARRHIEPDGTARPSEVKPGIDLALASTVGGAAVLLFGLIFAVPSAVKLSRLNSTKPEEQPTPG